MNARTGFVTQVIMEYAEAFEVAADLGFDYVELMMDGGNERQCLDPETVAETADDHGLDLAVHLPSRSTWGRRSNTSGRAWFES